MCFSGEEMNDIGKIKLFSFCASQWSMSGIYNIPPLGYNWLFTFCASQWTMSGIYNIPPLVYNWLSTFCGWIYWKSSSSRSCKCLFKSSFAEFYCLFLFIYFFLLSLIKLTTNDDSILYGSIMLTILIVVFLYF